MEQQVSGLKPYSLGIVLTAKVRGTDMIVVDPIESLPMSSGKIGEDSLNVDVSFSNKDGIEKKVKLEGGEAIGAKWISHGHSNRETAPDVQPGETVMLFRYGDTDQFYWTTIFREPELRRKETVRYAYSNQPSTGEAYDDKSSYWFEVSTHDQYIHLHTSINDGEPAQFDIVIDTKAGSLSIQDDMENNLEWNAVEGRLTANIREEIVLNTKNLKIAVEQMTELKTAIFELLAENSFNLQAPGATIGGGSAGGENGRVLTEGGLETDGNIEVDGNIHASGKIIDEEGNTNHHSH